MPRNPYTVSNIDRFVDQLCELILTDHEHAATALRDLEPLQAALVAVRVADRLERHRPKTAAGFVRDGSTWDHELRRAAFPPGEPGDDLEDQDDAGTSPVLEALAEEGILQTLDDEFGGDPWTDGSGLKVGDHRDLGSRWPDTPEAIRGRARDEARNS